MCKKIVKCVDNGNYTTIKISSEVDSLVERNVEKISNTLQKFPKENRLAKFVVDLTGIKLIDHAGLKFLLKLSNEAKTNNHRMVFAISNKDIIKNFNSIGFSSIINMDTSVESAVRCL